MRATFASLVVFLLAASPAWSETFNVSPTGDGSAMDLQAALSFACSNGESDHIRLLKGTYDASGGPFTIGVEGYDGEDIRLCGGYDSDFWQRPPVDPTATRLDGGGVSRVLDVRSDVAGKKLFLTLVNLTIQNGFVRDHEDPDDMGAGIRAWRENGGILLVQMLDCVLRDNEAAGTGRGGALGVNCYVQTYRTEFISNRARLGGAVYEIRGPGADSSFRSHYGASVFTGNDGVGDAAQGGAIHSDMSPRLGGCRFEGEPGGGSSGPGSPVFLTGGGSAEIVTSTFSGFTIDGSGSTIRFENSGGEITNCLFIENRAGGVGATEGYGAVSVHFDAGATQVPLTITNCTFAGNRSRDPLLSYGAAVDTTNHATKIENCIFWDDGLRCIYRRAGREVPSVGYSFVQGGLSGTGFSDAGGNLLEPTVTPFAGEDDYHPAVDSVCVDAGNDEAAEVRRYDRDGNGRPYDGDRDGIERVDMGAYELAPDFVSEQSMSHFGAVTVGQTAVRTVTLKNEGTLDLLLERVELKGFDVAEFTLTDPIAPYRKVPPGGSMKVEIVFAPATVGEKETFLDVTTDDPDFSHPIQLTGEGLPLPPTHVPEEGTIGTVVTLFGEGFGTRKGRVWLEHTDPTGETSNAPLRILEWADAEIRAVLRAKLPPREYSLMIRTGVEGSEPMVHGEFAVREPVNGDPRASKVAPGRRTSVGGNWFGDRKARPKLFFEYQDAKGRLKRRRFRIVRNSLEWDPATGQSWLAFSVPRMRAATGKLILVNRIGESRTPAGAFEVWRP